MILTTGKAFDRVRIESYPDYHGLVIEFQPDGHNAISGSPVIKMELGFIMLPSGQVGLSIKLPPESTFKSGTLFVLVNDKTGASKIILDSGIEFEKVK